MPRIEADKSFLMALANECILHGMGSVTIGSSLLSMDLLRVDLQDWRLGLIPTQRSMDDRITDLRLNLGDKGLERDLPDYYDLRDALRSSLVVWPDNLDELLSEISEVERRRSDPYRFPQQKLLAIDTNIAYNRLLSRLTLLMGGPVESFNPATIPVVIPSMVEEEISTVVGRKYSGWEVNQLKGATGTSSAEHMINCLHKSGRRALNAQTELKLIRELYSSRELRGGEFAEDKEERDERMIQVISDHASRQRCEVLFVTSDDKARAHAYSNRLPSICLEYPHETGGRFDMDPWIFPELLYDLALSFGELYVKGMGVKVLGAWPGKSADDYMMERLHLDLEKGSRLSSDLLTDHEVLESLSGIENIGQPY
ncbi:MAG: PIN domain-containing protein [Methanomassiliicoccales archaeon]